jgi:hypothetical protein
MKRTLRLAAGLLAVLAAVCASARPARAGDAGVSAAPHGPPVKVVVGAYVNRVTQMSLRENHFDVDFYVWFRWTGGDKDFDPLKTFDVANGAITQRTGEVHEEHKDFRYASCRIDAEITQFFDVSRFPFDDHVLRIEIEDTQSEAEFLEYVADTANSKVSPEAQVPGWTMGTPTAEVVPHRYGTNYGNVDLETGDASVYSEYAFSIPLARSGVGYFAKLFFGLFIAVGIALLALKIKPTDLDPRFGLPVGSIFAAVGSLYVVTSQLPDTNAITLSDRLHILAFAVIFVTLVESTMSLHRWSGGDDEGSKRLDRLAFRGLTVFYLVGAALAVWLS